MKAKVLIVALAALLILLVVIPVAALAGGTDSYSQYGANLRATYGASLGYNNPIAANAYGSRLHPGTFIYSNSYGTRLGFYNLQTQQTYGSRLSNRSGNPNVVPYRPGNASVNVTNW